MNSVPVPDLLARINVQDKRIFGGQTDLNQLVPFKYSWAWQSYLDANKNHWLPGHFSFDLDGDYNLLLTTDTLAVLQLYLGWRMAISRAIMERLPALYRATSAAECRQYMLRHLQEEQVAVMAIEDSGLLDLANMGVWVDVMANRIEQTLPDELNMLDHDFALFCSAMLVYKSYVLTSMETWLLKEQQLPPNLRKFVQALQRDGVGQRRFYTNLMQAFLAENPRLRPLVSAATKDTATDDAVANFRLHWSSRDLSHIVAGKAQLFAAHCWTSVLSAIGIPVKIQTSPYAQATAAQTADSNAKLSWD